MTPNVPGSFPPSTPSSSNAGSPYGPPSGQPGAAPIYGQPGAPSPSPSPATPAASGGIVWSALKPTQLGVFALVGLGVMLLIAAVWPLFTALAVGGATPPSMLGMLSTVRTILTVLVFVAVVLLGISAYVRSRGRDVLGFAAAAIGVWGLINVVINVVASFATALLY